ncbi:MAG: hypothetical protein HYX21_04230 [Candidatus Yanofskybacteria bacterium]|nr:hypothetical protein [Candidatus Yanofskybacteria bacterium]
MKKQPCCNNLILFLVLAAGLLFVSAVFVSTQAYAAEEGATPPPEVVKAALEDLSTATGQKITTNEQAAVLCDEEKYFTTCADIGKKHDLYEPEELKQVDAFVSEIKGNIASQLQSCQTTECLINVANELAQKVNAKSQSIAASLDLTPKIVQQKQAVITAAREIGVSYEDCRAMDPETAPIELLRGCAKLAKDSRAKELIPLEARKAAETYGDYADKMVELKASLNSGEFQCGNGTVQDCGNFCLNPGAEARARGTAAIPSVCRQIAKKFFGADGEKQLEASWTQVQQAQQVIFKKAESIIFTTIDGKVLSSPETIGKYMEEQGRRGNVEAVEKGMDFMIAKGFVSPKEKEYVLKFVKQARDRGGIPDFNACRTNPESCRDFIPEDQRDKFEAGTQVDQIMRQEIGFDPFECEKGRFDPAIGQKCLEGSRRALPKLEALKGKYKGIEFIIADIQKHVAQGEEFEKRKGEIQQVFQGQGGPGGCKSEQECFSYCSDPTHGPECIAFGAKQGVFRGDEAVQKFQQFNQNVQVSQQQQQQQTFYPNQGFPGQGYGVQGGFPGQGFGVQGGFPGPGLGGFSGCSPSLINLLGFGCHQMSTDSSGRQVFCNDNMSKSAKEGDSASTAGCPGAGGGYPGGPGPGFGGPVGQSPECFAAIQSGNLEKAKAACYVPPPSGQVIPPRTPFCPTVAYVECPAGQFKESYRNGEGCWVEGPCRPVPSYSPAPGGYSCPAGQWWDGATSSCTSSSSCGYGQYWDPGAQRCRSSTEAVSPYPYPSYTPYSYSSCSQSLTNLLGNGCHQMYTDSTGKQIFCNSEMTKSAKEGDTATTAGCAGGYQPYPSYSPYPTYSQPAGGLKGCFYTNASKNGQSPGYTVWCERDYYNCHQGDRSGATVSLDGLSLGSPSNCENGWPTTSYTPYPTGSYTPPPSCPSGQWWDYARSVCTSSSTYSPYPTTSSVCPSGSHNMGSYCMSDSDGTKCGPLNSASTSGFGSCSTYTNSTSYTPYPTYSTTPSGSCTGTSESACTAVTNCRWVQGSSANSSYCYNSGGSGTTYTPYPTTTASSSCPSGSHNMGSYCMSDSDGTKCGPLNSASTSGFGSCSTYTNSTSYTPYPTYSTSGTTYSPYPTYSSTPYPTTEYTPPPTTTYSPPPTTEYIPPTTIYTPPPESTTTTVPPSSFDTKAHQMAMARTIMACADSGGSWNAGTASCQPANSGFFANVLKIFSRFIR